MNPLNKIQTGKVNLLATYSGVLKKSLILFSITTLFAILLYITMVKSLTVPVLIISGILGLLLLFLTPKYLSYKQIAIPFAILEGVGIGTLTYLINLKVPTAGLYALGCTILSFFIVWSVYYFKLIKVTPRFISNTYISLFGISIVLLLLVILAFFKVIVLSPILIFTIFMLILLLGLCSLLIDFNDIDLSVKKGISDTEEWGLSISLLLSVILIFQSFLQIFGLEDIFD